MKEFNIDEMEIGSIHIQGKDLCSFSQEEFLQKVPNGEILWSHLELLRKCTWECFGKHDLFLRVRREVGRGSTEFECILNVSPVYFSDVLASQDQSGGDATVTIDQRKCSIEVSVLLNYII